MTDSGEHSHVLDIPYQAVAGPYLEALLAADRGRAYLIIKDALDNGLSIRDLYLGVFQPVLHEVGRLWLHNRVTVAEEHFCTAATQTIMSGLFPQIMSSTRLGKSLVASCVGSELHEIGVRMVADFFEMEGWDTYYIGAGIPHALLLSSLEQRKPDMVILSATMFQHVPQVQDLISAIRNFYSGAEPLIMVGGLPFNLTPDQWQTVGADLWAPDAAQAVDAAHRLLGIA